MVGCKVDELVSWPVVGRGVVCLGGFVWVGKRGLVRACGQFRQRCSIELQVESIQAGLCVTGSCVILASVT